MQTSAVFDVFLHRAGITAFICHLSDDGMGDFLGGSAKYLCAKCSK